MISAFGGNGYTAAKNLNLPIEEGDKLYNAYKKLHEGIFNWGEGVLEDAMKNGYIESAAGFKLKLPMFDRFKELQTKMDSFDKEFWTKYKIGKEENALMLESLEDKTQPPYVIQNNHTHQLYLNNKGTISEYFSMKSQYFRLCLNNPIQATAAHQTKKAACILFDTIIANGDLNKVRIAVIVHDEIQLEIKEELAEKYLPILSECMVIAGDHFLENKIVNMEADAVIGKDWGSSK
jgi:DNA polymerase I-like protein with 3'-5' exonuclease and polymerase domains